MNTSIPSIGPWLASALVAAAQSPQDDTQTLESQRLCAQERYARVEAELEARDLAGLTPDQREARANLLAVLDAYRTRADFGINRDVPGARVPLFVDGDGRRCAMAELLHATGRDDLVEQVQATNNLAWIVDLSANDALLGWLDAHGLTLEEAARIQGPGIGGGGPGTVVERGPVPRLPRPTDNPTTPSGTGGADRPSPSGPTTPGVGGPPSQPGFTPTPGGTTPPQAFTVAEDVSSWWLWWEYNKIEFLRPNRMPLESADDSGTSSSYRAFVRSVMQPAIERALEDGDPAVRGSAALTLGRIGGTTAVERLLALVHDANATVSEMAILGLGATGAKRAQEALLSLARDAHLPKSSRTVGRDSQALAMVALGIGRELGFEPSVDAAIVELVAQRTLPEREPLGVAAMMYATLAPSEALRGLAVELATDDGEPVAVRSRAIEALRTAADAPTLSKLQHLASGARIELRRSAALALGEFGHALVVPALQTAYDLEKDQLTRGFLLIALGRQGGDAARQHLLAELDHGPKPLRPWAALGLGLLAHDDANAEVAKALRERVASEKNSEARAAYWLASGLAGDVDAIEPIVAGLNGDATPRNRMYAAAALSLLGGDSVHAALLERVPQERSEMASSAIGLALGVLGRDGDSRVIAEVFETTDDPMFQGQVSSAMAFHGSSDALDRINRWIVSDSTQRATRAAATDGLGMMLGSAEPLRMGELARSSNYTLLAPWATAMLGTTL
jgi:HEAT repeat protein